MVDANYQAAHGMTTYLSQGWFDADAKAGLRAEVLDGAIDTAGMLHRAAIDPSVISRLALKIRGMIRFTDDAPSAFADTGREAMEGRLEPFLGDSPELRSFVADCLDHVTEPRDLLAFYLHLIHITRMMQLLVLAQRGPELGGLALAPEAPPEPAHKTGRPKKPRG